MKTKTKPAAKGIRLQEYYESLDLYAMWEKFSLSYEENGQHKYITVHSFIRKFTKDEKKREFLWWILGPTGGQPRNPEFAKYQQFDWDDKRGRQFWCSSAKIENIKREATARMSSIDEVKAIGAFNLDDMSRIKVLCDQLDSEFGGRLQLPNLSAKENDLRLNNYLALRQKLQAMLHDAQMMFAKTRSMDMSQLAEMLAVVGPSMIGQISSTQQVDENTQRKLNTFNDITQMMLAKSSSWGIDLPDKDMEKIIKKASEPTTIVVDKKKVQ